ncbi:hypothetical protein CVT26_012493 [Gymnopilus dilepis]|uniref:Secreted protein n=1 Tax=Gymnopilus dilepis TaxID=231916 RepID=A0A409YCZ3_9AGAR|nr:hypothetical protein CVT26_012493 [Gymnopilus dilepis]
MRWLESRLCFASLLFFSRTEIHTANQDGHKTLHFKGGRPSCSPFDEASPIIQLREVPVSLFKKSWLAVYYPCVHTSVVVVMVVNLGGYGWSGGIAPD